VTELLSEWSISKIIEQIDPSDNDYDGDLADYLFEQHREARLFKD